MVAPAPETASCLVPEAAPPDWSNSCGSQRAAKQRSVWLTLAASFMAMPMRLDCMSPPWPDAGAPPPDPDVNFFIACMAAALRARQRGILLKECGDLRAEGVGGHAAGVTLAISLLVLPLNVVLVEIVRGRRVPAQALDVGQSRREQGRIALVVSARSRSSSLQRRRVVDCTPRVSAASFKRKEVDVLPTEGAPPAPPWP